MKGREWHGGRKRQWDGGAGGEGLRKRKEGGKRENVEQGGAMRSEENYTGLKETRRGMKDVRDSGY